MPKFYFQERKTHYSRTFFLEKVEEKQKTFIDICFVAKKYKVHIINVIN